MQLEPNTHYGLAQLNGSLALKQVHDALLVYLQSVNLPPDDYMFQFFINKDGQGKVSIVGSRIVNIDLVGI